MIISKSVFQDWRVILDIEVKADEVNSENDVLTLA